MNKVTGTWYMNIYPVDNNITTFFSDVKIYETREKADKDQTHLIKRTACVPIKVVLDSFDGSFIRFVEK